MLHSQRFTIPYAAPSADIFIGNSPIGVRQGCRTLPKGQESLLATPNKNVGAQEASGIWVAFSLDTFFWRSKRKYLACQCENWFQKSRRGSDTKVKFHSRNYEC